ncbi:UNVERIFIED_CONTAM: Formin-like protein 18 [Sesamum latifolium]|uniref:Formin-like protein 18 n=1 Tax=Sesamum latifolium TaxID=2727402 RepID=A0AAW2XC75_9LAMI
MALFRKLFHRKPPDGLLEIYERVYVFDCCFTTDAFEDYKGYVGGIIAQLREHYPNASILAFNFREGQTQSQIANALTEYDMTIMEYPRQYEGCPLLPIEVIHHFLRSSESWLSLGLQNLLLMHCELGGWPVLAFMLAALLIYRKHYSGELKTLDMVYKQAPSELLHLLTPLNPVPSQLRYLQYVSRRNVATEWPPLDKALTMDCVIIRMIPNFDGDGGCRPIFRIYGQDPLQNSDRAPKILFSTPKKSKTVRHYKQAECELVKIDINCRIQGDVVLECISLHGDTEREKMMFRVMFNTAFIRSNILMLNRDDIDILWDAKELFPKDFRAEVLFSEIDTASSVVPADSPCFEEKDDLPEEAMDWLVPKGDATVEVLQNLALSNTVIDTHSHDEKSQAAALRGELLSCPSMESSQTHGDAQRQKLEDRAKKENKKLQRELNALKEDHAEEIKKLANQVRRDFPDTEEGKNYLEAYWASRLSEYQKSREYKKEVATIASPYLRFAFEACKQQFVAQGYPPTGEGTDFLNFDLVLDTAPDPFDKPTSAIEIQTAESEEDLHQILGTAEAVVRDDADHAPVNVSKEEMRRFP